MDKVYKNVKEEINASECAQYLDGEENCEVSSAKIEDVDITEQFIDGHEIYDRKNWLIKNEHKPFNNLFNQCDKIKLFSNQKIDRNHQHEEVPDTLLECNPNTLLECNPNTLLECNPNTLEYTSDYQKMLDKQINTHLRQVQRKHRKVSKLEQIIDWQLLIRSVNERPVLWNKLLYIYKQKIGKTLAWREVCRILKEYFEEMALEDQEHFDQLQSNSTDITLFVEDGSMNPNLNNFAPKPPSRNLQESKSTDLEPIPQTTLKVDDQVNCRSILSSEKSTVEPARSSTECPLTPSPEGESEKKILSKKQSKSCKKKRSKKPALRRHYCYYCEAPVLNFARHLERSHSDEMEVQKILSKPKNSKYRRDLITRLRKEGNYLKYLDGRKSTRTSSKSTKYSPCPFCLGFYASKMLWRHKEKCNENPEYNPSITPTCESFIKTAKIDKELSKQVFPRMRADIISVVAQQDTLIRSYGARYLKRHPTESHIQVTSRKMRELSRLLIEVKKIDSGVTEMMDILQPERYDTLVRVTKQITGYDPKRKEFKLPNFLTSVVASLRQCCAIALEGECISPTVSASEAKSGVKIFSSLIKESWSFDMYGKASKDFDTEEKSEDETGRKEQGTDEEEPRPNDQPQSNSTDITSFAEDDCRSSKVENFALKEATCNLRKSKPIDWLAEKFYPQINSEFDNEANCRLSPISEKSGEPERSSGGHQLTPSPEAEHPRKFVSEYERIPWRKKHTKKKTHCYYCEIPVLNFPRHIERSHSDEAEVRKIMSKPKNSKYRKDLLTRLRKKGNFLKRLASAKTMEASSKTARYIPCPFCLGFYSPKLLWRHKQKCNQNPKLDTSATGNAFPEIADIDKELTKTVFPRMRLDIISMVAQQDSLICECGARYLRFHHMKQHIHVTSRKMRELARLLLEVMKMASSVKTMIDILQPQHYYSTVEAAKQIAQYDKETKTYKTPNLITDIGRSLRQCCEIALEGKYISTTVDASEAKSAVKKFLSLMKGSWKYDMYGEVSSDFNAAEKSLPEVRLDLEPNLSLRGTTDKNEDKTDQEPLESRCYDTRVTAIEEKAANEGEQMCKKSVIKRVPWSDEQKNVVAKFFKNHIEKKKPPKRYECEKLISEHEELLKNKDWLKIKVFIQNIYTKKCKNFYID